MGMVSFSPPPLLMAGQPLSWADLEIFRKNAIALDAMSRSSRRAWTDQVALQLWRYGANPSPLMQGAFRFRTGMTTLTALITALISGGTHTAHVYFNGTLVASHVLSHGVTSVNVPIDNRGYTNGQIVEVMINISRNQDPPCIAYVTDVYCTPTTFGLGPYLGVPTFGPITQANMHQLAAAQQWLFAKMNMDHPLGIAVKGRALHWWPGTIEVWSGGVARSGNLTQLRIPIRYESYSRGPQSESLRLYFNGTYVATLPTWTRGSSGEFDFTVDLSGYPEHQNIRVNLVQFVEVGTGYDRNERGTRIWIGEVRVEDPSPSSGIIPQESTPAESMTFSTLQSRLNAIAALTQEAYARVMNSSDRWGRQRAYIMAPLKDAFQRNYYKDVYPVYGVRRGDILIVRGTDSKIGYGGVMKRELTANDLYADTYRFEEGLINGDTTQTRVVGYDTFPGLLAGATYYIIGSDTRYAAELLTTTI